MTNEKLIPTPEIPVAETVPTEATSALLGQLSIAEGRSTAIDIEVNAAGPAAYAPAHEGDYIGTAKKGPVIHESREEGQLATEYAQPIFPGSTFNYIGGGRYGVVLGDETGKAFKVYRNALSYSHVEKEAGALQLLHDAGLAPKPHLLIDADREYRLDRKPEERRGFDDVEILRQDGGRELPILVMDRIDAVSIDEAEPETLAEGFKKTAETFIANNILSWDTEVMVDKQTGKVIILDVGELSQVPFDAVTATPEQTLRHESEILRGIALDFGLMSADREILSAYKTGGLEAVAATVADIARSRSRSR